MHLFKSNASVKVLFTALIAMFIPLLSTTTLADTPVFEAPTKEQSELFIVFDDSGSMGGAVLNARRAVKSLLINTATTSKADELPFVHFFPLNFQPRKDVAYPYQSLIDSLEAGVPAASGGTPFVAKVNTVSSYIRSRAAKVAQENRKLKEAIVYIFTDGQPESDDGSRWVSSIKNLQNLGNSELSINIQLTVLGTAMPEYLYNKFVEVAAVEMEFASLSLSRTDRIEDIEVDAQALAERLLISRLQNQIRVAQRFVNQLSMMETLKNELKTIESEFALLNGDNNAKDIQKELDKAVQAFKSNKNQQNIEKITAEFKKLSTQTKTIQELKELIIGLEARGIRLQQNLNSIRSDMSEIAELISNMTNEQKLRYLSLFAEFDNVNQALAAIGDQDKVLLEDIRTVKSAIIENAKEVERGYSHILSNSSLLIEFIASLPNDVRLRIQRDLSTAQDIAFDYENKTIIYTGVHFFRGTGQNNGSSVQTNWTVINRGTMVILGNQGSGGAAAANFINEGVILNGSDSSARGGSTYVVNNGQILRLSQRLKLDKEKDETLNFHWQRVDENGETRFVVYDEGDGSIYQVTWDFILNFKRGTTLGGKVFNYFAQFFEERKIVNEIHKSLEDPESLKGEDASEFLQGIYPDRLRVLKRSSDEWYALVPAKLIPVFQDILCIEMNGDLGYGKSALTNDSLKRELDFKRKRQCGR